ncbi:MAG: flagellar protein FlaG [Candidatus Pristimantibacillus lignocellulolyticus]|uniref:Flagellar protein FlaG n=1 Tax=Candidatus Pristimantibacillus lignocellulolyticus TaxID=2994561 RepID=A0A9J6ZJC1_9BACL|nr:MAG: flagellar protein FlaG [Candidatus Pristimantibacillus lignocellulolyticus]
MFSSINRMDGSSVDWGQLSGVKKPVDSSQEIQKIGSSAQTTNNADSKFTEQDRDRLYKEVEKVNATLKMESKSMRIKFSEKAEQYYVEVFDSRTQEVIESIPGKHIIELAAKLKDMIGFFIDEKR